MTSVVLAQGITVAKVIAQSTVNSASHSPGQGNSKREQG